MGASGLSVRTLLLCSITATATASSAAPPAAVDIGAGGYPRGVQLLTGQWLICVGMTIHASQDGASWSKLSTVLTDNREGVDLANCNLAQLPSGRVLASYRHHIPLGPELTNYTLAVSGSDDLGKTWTELSTMVAGPVGMWEPFLWPAQASDKRPAGGGIYAAYSQELTNGGLQSIVWQRSTDRCAIPFEFPRFSCFNSAKLYNAIIDQFNDKCGTKLSEDIIWI